FNSSPGAAADSAAPVLRAGADAPDVPVRVFFHDGGSQNNKSVASLFAASLLNDTVALHELARGPAGPEVAVLQVTSVRDSTVWGTLRGITATQPGRTFAHSATVTFDTAIQRRTQLTVLPALKIDSFVVKRACCPSVV